MLSLFLAVALTAPEPAPAPQELKPVQIVGIWQVTTTGTDKVYYGICTIQKEKELHLARYVEEDGTKWLGVCRLKDGQLWIAWTQCDNTGKLQNIVLSVYRLDEPGKIVGSESGEVMTLLKGR